MQAQIKFSRSASDTEGGIYIVILAGVSAVLLAAVMLYLMMGAMGQHRTQLQKIADVTALAALEGFTEKLDAEGSSPTYTQKANEALARAVKISAANSAKFTLGSFGEGMRLGGSSDSISAGGSSSGLVRLGRWLPANSSGCSSSDPCFLPNELNAPDDTTVNAAQVTLCNSGSNPITLINSFVRPQYQCATALATLTNTCAAFLIDSSFSTINDTHYSSWRDVKVRRVELPISASSRIFEDSDTIPAGVAVAERIVAPLKRTGSWHPETNPAISSLAFYPQEARTADCNQARFTRDAGELWKAKLMWCSMPDTRPNSEPANDRVHYKSDYKDYVLPNGKTIWYDRFFESYSTYFAPQPMGNIFMAVNAALRRMIERGKTGADKAMMIVFQGNIVSKLPENGMTNDFGYMVQLTNLQNRGTIDKFGNDTSPQIQPNFMDMKWFPSWGEKGGTNIPMALDTAVDVMRRECAPTSNKVIMLFSDGMSTCARKYSGNTGGRPTFKSNYVKDGGDPNLKYDYLCANPSIEWDEQNLFNRAANQLFGMSTSLGEVDIGIDGNNRRPTALKLLKDNGIRLISVIAGKSVAPHEVNYLVDPDGAGPLPPHFMTQDEAYSLGYGGAQEWNANKWWGTWASGWPESPTKIFPCTSADDWATCASKQIPRLGAFWAWPNRIFSSMSLDSGGLFCALRPLCTATPRDEHFSNLEKPPCQSPPPSIPAGEFYYDHDGDPDTPKVLHPELRSDACSIPASPAPPGSTDPYIAPAGYYSVQFCSTQELTMSEQAAKCALDAVGANPYNLVSQQIN